MPISNYPQGFSNGITVRGVPLLNTYGGNVFWVDSGAGSNGNKGTFDRPFATIDYAVGRCTANNGDIIMAKPGHTETVIAAAGLDLDVAGITIVFMGNDNDRARVNFTTDVAADMDVDAADITLVNPRFTAGIDALTGPIDVNAARFTIINGLWEDGTTINTTDCIVADANADDMTIDGWTFRDGDAAGTQKQSQIQIAAATRPTLRNIKITGDFATGVVENGTAWVDALLENVNIDNANTSPTVAVLLQATSSGSMRNCSFRVASATTYVTANNDMQFYECYGTGTDATAAEKIGTQLAGDLEGIIGNVDTAAATGAVTATDSVMAYIKQLVTQVGVEADTDPVSAVLSGAGGITTWKSAAAPGTGISMSEVLRDVWDALRNGTGGTEPGTNKSVVDAIGFDGAAAVTSTAGMLRTAAGSVFLVKKTLTSSAVVQAGVDVTGLSAGGEVEIMAVHLMTDATGLATGTNVTLETNNTKGKAIFLTEAVASLGANATIISYLGNAGLADAGSFAPLLESGKKIIAKSTVADCTGGGTVDVYLVCRRLADGASLAAA